MGIRNFQPRQSVHRRVEFSASRSKWKLVFCIKKMQDWRKRAQNKERDSGMYIVKLRLIKSPKTDVMNVSDFQVSRPLSEAASKAEYAGLPQESSIY